MNPTKRTHCAAMVTLLLLISYPVAAAVEVLEAQGDLQYWALYGSTHGVCAGASWSHSVDEGLSFDLHATTEEGDCIESAWSGRCNESGLLFSGDLPLVTEGLHSWAIALDSHISVLLNLTTPARITANRYVEGFLSPAAHTVLLTFPDGSSDFLLGSSTEVNSADRLLDPGIYRIAFSIEILGAWDQPFYYTGLVEVNWDAPVGQEAQSWGGIKSLFHPGR